MREFKCAVLTLLSVMLLLCGLASAVTPTDRTSWKVTGYQTLSATTAVVSTLTRPANHSTWAADVFVEGSTIRYFCDGRTPTIATGHQAASGSYIHLQCYDEVTNFKVIVSSGGSGTTVYVTYLGQ